MSIFLKLLGISLIAVTVVVGSLYICVTGGAWLFGGHMGEYIGTFVWVIFGLAAMVYMLGDMLGIDMK